MPEMQVQAAASPPATGAGRALVVRAVRAELAAFYTRSGRTDRACYLLAAVLVAAGLFHLGVQLVAGGPWAGPVSWREPATFGVAFGAVLAAVTWTSTFLRISVRGRAVLLGLFAAACVLEVVDASVQAWRGVPFFFNSTTPLNALCAFSAAGGGAVLVISGVLLTVPALGRHRPDVSPSLRLATAFGFTTLQVALGTGVTMIVLGARTAGSSGSATAAFDATRVLVGAHIVALPGILVLPALAELASFTTWGQTRRTRVVTLACAGYLLCTTAVIIESFVDGTALTFVAVSPAATIAAIAGATGLLAAAVAILVGLCADRPRRPTAAQLPS